MQKKPQKLIQVTDKYGNTKQKAVAVIGAKDLDRLKLGSNSEKGSPTLMERNRTGSPGTRNDAMGAVQNVVQQKDPKAYLKKSFEKEMSKHGFNKDLNKISFISKAL